MDELDDKIKKLSEESTKKKKEEEPDEKKEKTIFERFKEKGVNVESDTDIEAYVEALNKKVADVESAHKKDKEEYEIKLKGVSEIDPMSFFSSPEAFKREQLKKQFPDIGIDVADRIISTDINGLSVEDRLILSMRADEPSLTDAEARAILESKYGLTDERTDAQRALMKLDSREAVNKLDKLKGSVKDPEKINTQAIREQQDRERKENLKKIEDDWSSRVSDVVNGFSKFSVTDKNGDKEEELINLDVEGDFKERMIKDIPKYFVDNHIPYSPEAVKYAQAEMYETYFRENRVKIIKKIANTFADKREEQVRQEYAGMSPVNKGTKKPEEVNTITESARQKMLNGEQSDIIKPVKY